MTDVQISRHFSNDGPLLSLTRPPRDEIISGLQKLITKYPPGVGMFPSEELNGLFSGPTSIAYLLFKLSEPGSRYEDFSVANHSLRYWADAYLDCAEESVQDGHRPVDDEPGKSRYGVLFEIPARLALSAAFRKDKKANRDLLALLPKVLDGSEEIVWNEHLYGRTGYLYLLRLVRTYWPEAPIPPDAYTQIIRRVLLDGKSRWKFVDKYLLGAGHGWISVVTQILLTDQSYAAACKPALEQILNEQILDRGDPDYGNWDAFLVDECKSDRRLQIQWGHGAPGIVISLQSMLPAYKDLDPEFANRMEEAINQAQEIIWEKGLLRKESCLCHGAAGNMLGLTDRKRKEHFLAWSTEDVVQRGLEDGSSEPSSYSSSLHRGLAGRIWAFYVFEGGATGYPSYNDL